MSSSTDLLVYTDHDLQLFPYNLTPQSIYNLINQFVKGIELKDRTFLLSQYKSCFIGKEAVDWLRQQNPSLVITRSQLSVLFEMLRLFSHVVSDSKKFSDSYSFYRFRGTDKEFFKLVVSEYVDSQAEKELEAIEGDIYSKMKEIKIQPRTESSSEMSGMTVLFLGSSSTGKTTLYRNIKHSMAGNQTIPEEETVSIYNTMIQSLNELMSDVDFKNEKDFDMKYKSAFDDFYNNAYPITDEQFSEAVPIMKKIWATEGMKIAFKSRLKKNLQSNDNFDKLMNEIDKLAKEKASFRDYIFNYRRSTGVSVAKFKYFNIMDVGGQKSERKKWRRVYGETKSVYFFVSLSSFNELNLDDETNKMQDSIELFQNCIKELDSIPFWIIFTKKDILEDIYDTNDIKSVFPEFSGENVQNAIEFLQSIFKNEKIRGYKIINCLDSVDSIIKELEELDE
eukprot:gene12496-6244_t